MVNARCGQFRMVLLEIYWLTTNKNYDYLKKFEPSRFLIVFKILFHRGKLIFRKIDCDRYYSIGFQFTYLLVNHLLNHRLVWFSWWLSIALFKLHSYTRKLYFWVGTIWVRAEPIIDVRLFGYLKVWVFSVIRGFWFNLITRVKSI